MDGDVLPGESGHEPDLLCVRPGDAARLSRPGRTVRELVRAGLRDPGRPALAARPDGGADRASDREQPLYPDWIDPADRVISQKRDPDRGSRARPSYPRRQAAAGFRRRGGARTLSA